MVEKTVSQRIERMTATVRRCLIPKRARCFPLCKQLLADSVGLEIGGPSQIFTRNGALPVYPVLKQLDNCNFSEKTIWETVNQDTSFGYDEKRSQGNQYIAEATDLQMISPETYDCVLASHVIEHIANPLQALSEWIRVLKEMGVLVLIVPHKDGTFDHRRSVTPLDHLIEDYECKRPEKDLTHLPEILKLHDLELDPGAGTLEAFKRRSEKNSENRALHHHVFDTASVVRLIHHMNLEILAVEPRLPHHIIAVTRKMPAGQLPDNQFFVENKGRYKSPFPTDKHP